jgi:WD40 repeat protein
MSFLIRTSPLFILIWVNFATAQPPRPVPAWGQDGRHKTLCFLDDTAIVIGTSDGRLLGWGLDGGVVKSRFDHKVCNKAIVELAPLSVGKKIVYCTMWKLCVFDLCSLATDIELDFESGINGVAVLPNGRDAIVLCGDGTAQIYDLQTKKRLATFAPDERTHDITEDGKPKPVCASVSADGQYVAVSYGLLFRDGCNGVHIWDAKTHKHLLGVRAGWTSVAWSVAFHPKLSTELALPGVSNSVDVLNIDKKQRSVLFQLPPKSTPTRICYSPSGDYLAVDEFQGSVILLDHKKVRSLLEYDTSKSVIGRLVFSPDSKLLAVLQIDGTDRAATRLFLFDSASGRCVSKDNAK